MKKLLLCGVVAAGCCLSSAAQSKINNAGQVQIDQFNRLQQELALASPQRAAALAKNVTVYVTLAPGASIADLEDYGVTVLDTTSDMAIVSLPITEVEALAEEDFVKNIDFGYQAAPFMDQARQLSFMAGVHDGTAEGLDKAYKGNGVYVSLYDTGLDPNHINFTDASGKSRVKAVYLVNNGTPSPYETPETVALFTTDDRTQSHGTHVLGTITGRAGINGNYAYSEGASTKLAEGAIPYYGVAPEADILVGCGSFDDASINAGIGAIVDKAKSEGRPVIVNLSLGHNRGSHDPRETVNRYLDSRAQDAIIVVAAGNEGGSQMSFEREFTRATSVRTSIVPTSTNQKAYVMYTAEFWNNSSTPFTAQAVLFNKTTKKVVFTRDITGKSGSMTINTNTDALIADNFESGTSFSIRWGVDGSTDRFNIYMYNISQSKNGNLVFGIIINGDNGMRINGYCDAFDGYSESEVRFANQTGWAGSITGTDVGSINGMACGYNTVSVGAWVSRTNVPQLSGGKVTINAGEGVGSIANFSSYGKSGDGRQLPIVCAPGAQIISSVSRYWTDSSKLSESAWSAKATSGNNTYPWYYMQGTSMATPFVSGALALWLEACPGMRGKEAQDIIAATSTKDSFVTAAQADRWGAGKINVLAGLKKAIELSASVKSTLADNADKNLIVAPLGGKQYEVSCVGVDNLTCALYNLQGSLALTAGSEGDTVNLDASSLQPGIYVLSVNAAGQNLSRKLVIK
ncbi:MAG: S8 family peptidase [Muribaculaceae bacterium]|nr:S8 family peptidase [Muribaculaceae bacterium]